MASDVGLEAARTVEHIAARWRGREVDRGIMRHLVRLLAEGRAVAPGRLAAAAGREPGVVGEAIERCRCDRDRDGNVTEVFGITLAPTLHRIEVGNGALFSCCALVSQMVAVVLDRRVAVESVDPVDHRIVRLVIEPEGVRSVTPEAAVATLPVTEQTEVLRDVSAAFCCHVRHFAGPDTAGEFARVTRSRYVVSLDALHAAARALHAAVWS